MILILHVHYLNHRIILSVLIYFWRRQWHPTPVLLPGKSHGLRSLEGCSPWGRWGSDTTEWLHFHFSLSCIGEGNGNPLQCSCLENPRDSGAWWAAVYGVTESRTQLKWLSSSSNLLYLVMLDIHGIPYQSLLFIFFSLHNQISLSSPHYIQNIVFASLKNKRKARRTTLFQESFRFLRADQKHIWKTNWKLFLDCMRLK